MSPFSLSFDPYTFIIGFFTATIFWWLLGRARPLWKDAWRALRENRAAAELRGASSHELNFRRMIFRRAQGLHLAAALFPLDEILIEPLFLAPPPAIEPGLPPPPEDLVSQTIPYLPAWPELAAIYRTSSLTLPQALVGVNHIVIIGQPGAGKTVALANLASLVANQDERLGDLARLFPFLVHVADLKLPVSDPKDVLKPILETVNEQVSILDLGRLPIFIQNTFKSGLALLLVDGIDETTQTDQQTVSEYFKLLLHAYPKTRIVATGAPEYLDGLINLGFTPLPLLGWSDQRVTQFFERWGKVWLENVLPENPDQADINHVDSYLLNIWLEPAKAIYSPLELTLKAWAAYAGDSLGPQVLEAIASHIRRIAPSGTPLAALETLAMQVVLNSQPIFDSRNARQWVRAFEPVEEKSPGDIDTAPIEEEPVEETRPKKGKSGQKILQRPTPGLLGKMAASGLLLAHSNNRMRFSHPVFGGYLAGRALSNYKGEQALLNQSDWSGKYLAMRYLAAHGDATPILENMLEWSRPPMHRPLLSAARWLRDAPHDAIWIGKLYATLAALLQTDGIPLGLRAQVVAALIVTGDPNAATLFRQFANTLSLELMQLSALGCGAMKDVKAIPLLERALEAPGLMARRAACLALVAIGTDRSLEIVTHTLLNADEDLRRVAAEALANDPQEGHAILKDGAAHKDFLLRRAIVYGLARVDAAWADDLLQKMQLEDDQWVVRNAAAEVLEVRSDPGLRAPHKIKAPSESPWLIAFASKQGVGISPGSPAADVLLLALKSDNPDIRLASLPYLKHMPTEGVISQMYNAMAMDDPELREAVYLALWEIGASGIKLKDPSQYGLN